MANVTRRQFGKAAAAVWMTTAAGSRRVRGANDRVRLGFIGVGNRGDQVLDAFLAHKDAEVVAVCDIYQPYVDFAAQKVGGHASPAARLPQAARHEGHRRRRHLHAGPLARAADDPRVPGRQGRVRREAAVARRRRGTRDGATRPAGTTGWCRSASIGARRSFVKEAVELVRERRARQGHGRAILPRPERVADAASAPRRTSEPPAGVRLGRVARPRAEARLQQEPHVLPLPLVLRLLGRAGHQLRRPLHGRDPVGARPRRAAGGHRDGRQVRHRGQPRGPRHARGALDVSGRHARHLLAVQRDGGAASAGQPRARSSSAARRGRCICTATATRWCRTRSRRTSFPHARRWTDSYERRLSGGRQGADREARVTGRACRHRRSRAELPRLRDAAAPRATATSRPATAARRPRSSRTSRTRRSRTSSGIARPSDSRTTSRPTRC